MPRYKNNSSYQYCILFFLILTTISFSSTTIFSRSYIEFIRIASIVYIVISLIFLSSTQSLRQSIVPISIFLLLLSYGLVLSLINGGIRHVDDRLITNIAVIISGILAFSIQKRELFSLNIVVKFILYLLIIFLINAATGGFIFSSPPSFIFEYSSVLSGADIVYSQGVSKFFGFGMICSIFLLVNINARYMKIILSILFILLSYLSLIGGGRGDFIAAMLVAMLYLLVNTSRKNAIYVALIIFSFILAAYTLDFERYTFFYRFTALLEGNLGQRDVLLSQSLRLLENEQACLWVGCGFGFFQNYYTYPSGLYPHNIFVEFVIIFGLPIFIFLFVSSFIGIVRFMKNSNAVDAIFLVLLFFIIIDSKSGTVLGAWMTFSLCVFFTAYAFTYAHNKNIAKSTRMKN